MPDGGVSTLPSSFTVLPSGQAHLETRLIMPSDVGRHTPATFYVEYANTGGVAMQAPLIRLQSADADGSDRPIMTLDQSLVSPGFWTTGMPDGFSTSVQILGNGATPGLLNPGERITVPVYYVGLLQPWNTNDGQVEMELRVFDSANTDPVPWSTLQDDLRPPTIQPDAWNAIYGNIVSNVGPTWGSFVQMLSDNAQFLGRLGERVFDVGQLWSFEVQQAIGFNPISTLASSIDAEMPTPGTGLSFGRTYTLSIDQRFTTSVFGFGWSAPWLTHLSVDADGSVNISGAGGSIRRFQPDSRTPNTFFALPGDSGILSLVSTGIYAIREQNGSVIRFNTSGDIDWLRDANGNQVTLGYAAGRLTTLTHSSGASLSLAYSGAGLVSSITDSAGRATTFAYDPANQYLLAVTAPDGQVTSYTYDTSNSPRQHALLSVTSSGSTRFYTYDGEGHLASTSKTGDASHINFTYDTAGQVNVTTADGGTASFFYDYLGLLGRVVDPLGNITTSEYGADLRLRRTVDPLGQSQSFTWSSLGDLTGTTNALGYATSFSYGYVGPNNTIRRMTSFTDAKGNTTHYTYDAHGNLLSTIYPDQSIERVGSYDPAGDPLSFVNRRGQTLSYAYNPAGQVTRETFQDNSFNDFTYDARGNLRTVTEPGTLVTTFDYDSGDRLTRVTYPNARFLAFTYDSFGRRSTMTDQTGFTVNYAFDSAGRLQRLTDGLNTVIVQYTYDMTGRLSRQDNGNATYTTYSYDLNGQTLSIVNHAPNGSVNSRFDYTYDVLGRRTGMTTIDGTWAYGYDATGQLTSAAFSPFVGSPIPAQDLQYVYDALGNRIQTIENGVTTNYTTNNLNQYTQVGGDTLIYDADGNLISRSGPSGNATYTYDQQNRLTRVVTPDGIWQYEYDSFGDRTASTFNGQRTEYMLDPSGLVNVVGEYTGVGTVAARYIHGLGLVAQQQGANGTRAFYDFDGVGSTADLTGWSGQVLNRYVYQPFGTVLATTGATANPFQFVGRFGVFHQGDGSDLMWARTYQATEGRFTTCDPLRLLAGFNMMAYVDNAPTNFIDPFGLDEQSPDIATGIEATANGILEHTVGEYGGIAGKAVAPGVGLGMSAAGVLVHDPKATVDALRGYQVKNETGYYGDFAETLREVYRAVGKDVRGNPLVVPPPSPDVACDDQGGEAGASCNAHSSDPNHLLGPSGSGPQNYVRSDTFLPYRIEFENYGPGSVNADGTPVSSDRWATAPAQRVVISNTLSSNLDLDTFLLASFGFGDFNISLETPAQSFQQVLTMLFNGRALQVSFEASLDYATRTLRAVFQSLDPLTALPPDVLTGFLPPEDGTGRGLGFVTYTLRPMTGLPTGTQIRNVALIAFDNQTFIASNQVDPLNPALGTDPTKEALVTLDSGDPTTTMKPLPAVSINPNFVVSWSGRDDPNGSGVANYSVFVSTDNGPYSAWLTASPLYSSMFHGATGHSYRFYTVATDNVGHIQTLPIGPQATTTVPLSFNSSRR